MLKGLSPNARVWVYQSDRAFSDEEVTAIKSKMAEFTGAWTAHDNRLTSGGDVLYKHFIIFGVDESFASASGCSIDKSVNFVKQVEEEYKVDMFNRMCFAYMVDGDVKTAHREAFGAAYAAGDINDQTTVFNNLVNTNEALAASWQVALGDSWHKNMV